MDIFVDSNTVVKWTDFVNSATGSPITDATINGSVTDLDGSELTTFSLSYSSDLASYTGTFSSTGFASGNEYYVVLTATKGSTVGVKKHRAIAKYDSFN